jgi:hypothetical protein
VCHMRVHHKEVVITDDRMAPAAVRSAMNVYVFAENVVGADSQTRVLTLELKILRLESDRAEWKEMIVVADRCWTLDNHMRLESAAVSDRHAITDPAIRTDEYVGTHFCFGADDCRGVNHGC